MAQYHSLSKELRERILEDREKHKKNPYAFPDEKNRETTHGPR